MANSDLARIIKRIKDLEVRVKFLSRKDGERSHKHKELTIAAGEVDVQERDFYFLHPESSTTDELDTINGGQDGFVVALQLASGGDTIILKDGTGNLQLNGDLELSSIFDVAYLIYRETDTTWCQIGFNHSTGGAIDADTLQGHPASDFVLVADLFDDDEGDPVDVGTTADGTSDFAARRDHSHALADDAVTTTKILDGNVTYAKIQNVTADRVLGSILGGTVEEITLTLFGRSLIDDADAATARTTLGLGTIATQPETAYALLAGRSGGQHLKGGTDSGNNLTLESTNHATKGKILFGTSAYDEVNNRLGVGLNTPTDKLHVSGGGLILFNSVDDFTAIRMRPSDGNKITRIQAIGDNTLAHSAVVFSQVLPTGAGNPTDGKMEFQTMDAGVLATRMTILDSGNVGIANASPQAKLHVGAGGDASAFGATTLILASAAGDTALSVRNSTNDVETFLYASTGVGYVGMVTNHALRFQTNNLDRGAIDTSGNWGVGTVSPATRLNVVGTTATLRFGTAGESDSSAFWIDVATSGGLTNSGHGRTLVVKAGDTDNSAGRVGGALYLRGGTPISPATTYGKVVINDLGGFVGVGTDEPSAQLSIQAGSSTDHANAGGVLHVNTTQTGNVGTGEDTLASYSVPANTLATNGDSLWVEATFTFADNFNAKTTRIRFGSSGTTLVLQGSSGGGGGVGFVRGRIVRTGETSQIAMGTGTGVGTFGSASLDQTLSGAVTISVTGTATDNNDIVCTSFIVGWDPNNS